MFSSLIWSCFNNHAAHTCLNLPLLLPMASDRGQNRYSHSMGTQTLLRFDNCSSSYCLFSSRLRVSLSFHRTLFFGAPLALLCVMKFFFRHILFLEASQWACFVVASLSCPCVFGSSFPRLRYIQDTDKTTFSAFVAPGSHRPKQYGEKDDGGGVYFKGRSCQNWE